MPRWFRVAVAVEIAGAIACAVVGARVLTAGAHAAGAALTWMRPAQHASPPPRESRSVMPLPTAHVSSHPVVGGVGVLTPELLSRLNRQTGAFAMTEYSLLVDLEALARDEATRLLNGVHVPPAP
jgi:hypothetical protein